MSLLIDIKNASIAARKNRSTTAAFLVTLYSEVASVGKTKRNADSTDDEAISILNKFKAGAQAIIEAASDNLTEKSAARIANSTTEIELIDQFLPKMLTETALKAIIIQYFYDLGGGKLERDPKLQMGNFMTQLKKEHAGTYDGAVASQIVKEILSQ